MLHETKNLSRVNGFECGCTQTLDKPFSFMQFGSQEELRQNLPQLLDDLLDEANKNISAYNSNCFVNGVQSGLPIKRFCNYI